MNQIPYRTFLLETFHIELIGQPIGLQLYDVCTINVNLERSFWNVQFKFQNLNFLDSIGIKFESDHCLFRERTSKKV